MDTQKNSFILLTMENNRLQCILMTLHYFSHTEIDVHPWGELLNAYYIICLLVYIMYFVRNIYRSFHAIIYCLRVIIDESEFSVGITFKCNKSFNITWCVVNYIHHMLHIRLHKWIRVHFCLLKEIAEGEFSAVPNGTKFLQIL